MSTTSTFQIASARTPVTAISAISCAKGGAYASAAIDNSTNLDAFCHIKITWTGTTSHLPVAGDPLKFYLLYAADGTNYEDGTPSTNDGSTAPPTATPLNPDCFIGVASMYNDANAHTYVIRDRALLPFKFKLLVVNGSTGDSSSAVVVTAVVYGDNMQGVTP